MFLTSPAGWSASPDWRRPKRNREPDPGTLAWMRFGRYSNGQITIADRAGLEAAACEYHCVVAREFKHLLDVAWR